MINLVLAALAAAATALIFPKFDLSWLAWLALAPFFVSLQRSKSWRAAMSCGLVFGLIFFGIHLAWVLTLFRFVQWWIALGWISLVLFQTLFILLFVLLFRLIRWLGFAGALAVALLWTAIEWLRAWGPFGVTGGDLGYSQVQFLPLIQIASFSSVYGVSFLLALFNASAAQFLLDRRKWQWLVIALVLVLLAAGYGEFVMRASADSQVPGRGLKIALIQPNIDQKDRLNPAKVGEIYRINEKMTRQALRQKPEVVVWPETALFTYVLHDQALLAKIKKLVRRSKIWLIMGLPHYVGTKAYNSLVSISPSGEVISRYDKQHLVPFGEYLPFRPLLYPWLRGLGYYDTEFSANPYPKPLRAGGRTIAAAICFESTFPQVIKKRVGPESDFILLVTNDAWFADSSALYFHLNTGALRAVENRKYFAQAGNTGLTALIDPYGRILKQAAANQRQTLFFEIPLP